jgi:glycosyltransferase involved in cell wall biosynthesis
MDLQMSFQNSPRISIITISYNCAGFIRQALDSVVAQDYADLDYIVVDGGSTDGTLEIIKKYADRDVRIRWISEPDEGIADAMNKGLAMAEGEIVGHLHGDDFYIRKDVLSTVIAMFSANPGAIWLTGGAHLVNADGKVLREIKVRNCTYRRQLCVNRVIHPSTFVKKSALEKVGRFDTSLRYAMDYDLWLRLGQEAGPLHLDQVLAAFRVHGGSLSASESEQAFAEEYEVRRKYLRGNLPRLFINYLYFSTMKPFHKRYIGNLLGRGRRT